MVCLEPAPRQDCPSVRCVQVAVLLHLLKEEVARALPLPPSSAVAPPAAPAAGLFPGERILAVVGRTLAPQGRAGCPVPQLPDEADVVSDEGGRGHHT